MKIPTWLIPVTSFTSAALMMALICGGFLVVTTNASLPDAQSIKQVELKIPLRVFSSEGLLISEFGSERRKRVKLEDTPQHLIDAVLASEDDNFYQHSGIDFKGLLRAALSNFRSGATEQGASTITMQVARNFFLTREKTYERKLREVLLALKLEQILSKDEILELYLNKIFLGHRSYGFGAAADVYYDRELVDLSLPEFAMLAGLPKAPSSNNPISNPERSITRRNYVLKRLLDLNKIDATQYQQAISAPITAQRHGKNGELWAPHVAEMVRAELTKEFGENAYWAGLNVYTTLQAPAQNAAQRSIRSGLQSYDQRHGYRGPISKVELERLAPSGSDEATKAESYDKFLSQFPDSQEQKPALITAVAKEKAHAYIRGIGTIELDLENSKWARRYINANKVGDPVASLEDVLREGDVVYCQPLELEQAKEAIEQEVSELEPALIAWRLSQIPNIGGAIISLEPATGRIISLVGGYDFFLNKYNRAIQSIRQPGSNIKPFIYSAALDNGFSPSSLISGAPIVITDPLHGTVWRPENYSGKFFGPTRMREALAKSLNLVSIRLLRAISIYSAKEYLDRFGINTNRFASSLTMALGSGGVTPLELLGAYGALANGGYRIQPYFIDHITDRDGRVIYQSQAPSYCEECYQQYLPKTEEQIAEAAELEALAKELEISATEIAEESSATETIAEDLAENELDAVALVDPEATEQSTSFLNEPIIKSYEAPRIMNQANNFLIRNMLKDVIQHGTARKAKALNRLDLAGKTGTTNDYIDAWFTGFNSKIATTVWIGFDEPQTMGHGEAGSVAALPIWIDYMKDALLEIPEEEEVIPDFIASGFVNRDTGVLTDESDPDAVAEYFPIASLLPEPMGATHMQVDAETNLIDHQDDSGFGLNEDDEYGFERLQENEDFDDLEQTEPHESSQPKIIEDQEDTEGLF